MSKVQLGYKQDMAKYAQQIIKYNKIMNNN